MIHEVEALPHGKVFVRFSDTALDHHLPDPSVDDQLTPDEADALAAELVAAARKCRESAHGPRLRIMVWLDLGRRGEDFLQACKDEAPEGWVSIDHTLLRLDDDDSFYLFELVE